MAKNNKLGRSETLFEWLNSFNIILLALILTIGTWSCGSSPPPVIPPSQLWITSQSATGLSLNWSGGEGVGSYIVERSDDGQTFYEIVSVKSPTSSFTDSYLDTTKSYKYRIKCVGWEDQVAYSKTITAEYKLNNKLLSTASIFPKNLTNLSLSPDGAYMIGWIDRHFYILNTSTWSYIASISADIRAAYFTQDSKLLVTIEDSKKINIRTFPNLIIQKALNTNSTSIYSLAITPTGHLAVISDIVGSVEVWDLNNAKLIQKLESNPYSTALTISPDGKTLITCGRYSFDVWNLDQRKMVVSIYGYFYDALFNHRGTILSVTAAESDTYGKIGGNYFTSDWALMYNTVGVLERAFSPDDSLELFVSENKTKLNLILVDNGKIIRTFSSEGKSVQFVSFFTDGEKYFTISSDSEVKIYSNTILVKLWTGSF
ncbi:MAG: hypothetical protein WC209_14895 [Ignavibacteriaceae bacterium]|jgi:hypothetical protein